MAVDAVATVYPAVAKATTTTTSALNAVLLLTAVYLLSWPWLRCKAKVTPILVFSTISLPTRLRLIFALNSLQLFIRFLFIFQIFFCVVLIAFSWPQTAMAYLLCPTVIAY